jgi:hypothetical protein
MRKERNAQIEENRRMKRKFYIPRQSEDEILD